MRRYSKKADFRLLDFLVRFLTMGKGKRKAEDTKAGEQPKDQELGLVTNTDYHTGGSYARTFQQIYEDYKTDT